MMYGSLTKITTQFLVSDRHATLILNAIPKDNHVWSVNSNSVPYVLGYKSILESKGYSVEEFSSDNKELTRKYHTVP